MLELGSPPESWPWETNDDHEAQGEQLPEASGRVEMALSLLDGMIWGKHRTTSSMIIYIYILYIIYIMYIYVCVCYLYIYIMIFRNFLPCVCAEE